ncbi:unnamed protein product [Euphydryas editha]|uniref:Uncharacterized protein n=1 Tax=Euphydryas editha TaxID=104508 RepID=A0AAU9U7K8_EUPED|nr:unnamed protein product [Euphydryas editha]
MQVLTKGPVPGKYLRQSEGQHPVPQEGETWLYFLVNSQKDTRPDPGHIQHKGVAMYAPRQNRVLKGKNVAFQYHRCLQFRHSSHGCQRRLACVQCGDEHTAKDCFRSKERVNRRDIRNRNSVISGGIKNKKKISAGPSSMFPH